MPHFASPRVCVLFHLISSVFSFSNLENGTKHALFHLTSDMCPISPHLECVCGFSNLKNGTKRILFCLTLSMSHFISSQVYVWFFNLENVTKRTSFGLHLEHVYIIIYIILVF